MTTGKNLHKNLESFLRHIDAIRDTLPMTMLLIQPYNEKANDDFSKFLNENVEEIEDDNGKKRLLVKADESKKFETLERNASTSALASKIIPESLFVSLISQYDAFLTRLLRAIYEIRPDVLNGSERNLTFSQLVEMETVENARDFIIDKEIDTVLRKSHAEQFDYLEKLLGIKLREKLPIWKTFIEITERRNLLVHCDGVVSNQYVKNCKEHKCQIDKIKVGQRLGIEPKYFINAYKCLYEIATKLTHTIWRKLLISDLKDADRELNDVCFHLINTNSFELADILLEFGCNQKRHFNNSLKNVFIVNGSLSKYLQDKKEEAKQILDKKDWSASSDDFKLAYAVLTDDYEIAYEMMLKIGDNGDVDKSDYKQWPLFNKIREEEKFKETYTEIFREEYSVMETPMKPIQELINKELKKNKELKEKTVKKVDSAKELKEKESTTPNKSNRCTTRHQE
ncbi:hypothetical protein [Zobellia uliginosa]|uniref:hypothetical protein n=1 Tax=Zobellia uliginosa TaxID=143224 RepID=UPI0026E265BF|nr:hypothetical protein [Zobellia uliginosa]MDO6516583.1 hypothetical protein [Zobellia uliginosa]